MAANTINRNRNTRNAINLVDNFVYTFTTSVEFLPSILSFLQLKYHSQKVIRSHYITSAIQRVKFEQTGLVLKALNALLMVPERTVSI